MSLFSVHDGYVFVTVIIYIFYSLTCPSFPTAISRKFQPDLSIVQIRELNFILCSEIFMHYDGQLRASHLILVCMPLYTSYQDSLDALTIDSPLLSYLEVRLSRFMPHELTSGEARH